VRATRSRREPGLLQRRLQRRQQALGVPVGQGGVQAVLVAEVPVQDRLGDAGLGGDHRHGRRRSVALDDPVGGVEQRLRRSARPSSGTVPVTGPRRPSLRCAHGICMPEIARLMIRRWISLVPSKIV
jgi:hypothetical protein